MDNGDSISPVSASTAEYLGRGSRRESHARFAAGAGQAVRPEQASSTRRARRTASAFAQHALLMFPNRGRLGQKEGTRELVMSPLLDIVVYTVRGDAIYVVRILHGTQQGP